jgi:hypothetical protein
MAGFLVRNSAVSVPNQPHAPASALSGIAQQDDPAQPYTSRHLNEGGLTGTATM